VLIRIELGDNNINLFIYKVVFIMNSCIQRFSSSNKIS